jgi:hypothetical protein
MARIDPHFRFAAANLSILYCRKDLTNFNDAEIEKMAAICGICARAVERRASIALAALLIALCPGGGANATIMRGGAATGIAAPAADAAKLQPDHAVNFDMARMPEQEADPPGLGLHALSEALREDARIAAILRGIMPDGAALMPGQRDANLPQPGASAAYTQSRPEPEPTAEISSDVANSALEVDDQGRVSLRQALQAIRGPDLGAAQGATRARGNSDDPDDDIDITVDLRREILDNRFLGEALAQVIGVNSLDGTFSIFGIGHFTLDSHGQSMTDLTDSSTFGLSSPDLVDRSLQRHHDDTAKIDVLSLLLAFFESPAGELVAAFLATALLAWSTTRIAARLRR